MARPVQISDRDLLAAARKVFLKRGVQATTAEVAEVAGVSEGSLFKRWKTKAELFHASLIEQHGDEQSGRHEHAPAWALGLPARVGRGSVRKELMELTLELVAFHRLVAPLAAMAWSEPSVRSRVRREQEVPGPVRGVHALADYFRQEMRLGRLQEGDAVVVARTMIGATFGYAWMEITFGADRAELEPEQDFAKDLVDFFLRGLSPAEGSRSARNKKSARVRQGVSG